MFIAIASWAWHAKGFFDNIDEITSMPVDPVMLIMTVGIGMFLITFSGCIGALRENIIMLKFFATVLMCIFFGQLILGVLAFVYKDWFEQRMSEFILLTIDRYRDDPDLQNMIDLAQSTLECCGGDGPNDWQANIYFNCTSKVLVNGIEYRPVESCGVPFSCCIPPQYSEDAFDNVINTQCGYGVLKSVESNWPDSIYTEGCVEVFEQWIARNLYKVAIFFIVFAVLEILPICFAQTVVQDIENIRANWRS